jgi:hypothetical protein
MIDVDIKYFNLINIDFEKLDLSKFSNKSLIDLSTILTIRLCNSMIFGYYGSNMDKQVRIRNNISKLQKFIRIELLKRLGDVDNE